MAGYTGKIIKLDLCTNQVQIEYKDDEFYRLHFGGRNIICHYLMNELPEYTDPLAPDNLLIFATGVVTGVPLAGCGRNSVGAKSPVTGGYGEAEAGGYFGAELKKAGYDALVIKGKAKKPVILIIEDENIRIEDAGNLWGQKVADVDKYLKESIHKTVRTAIIGPGAEKLVQYGCILNDIVHAYGRNGIGAVMGSKNLKAVAVKGTGKVELAAPEEIKRIAKWFKETSDITMGWAKSMGTPGSLLVQNLIGGLPTRNFQEGCFEGAEKISGESMHEKYLVGRDTCFACSVRCKQVVKINNERIKVDSVYGGPEYETLAAFGSMCGVDDLEYICKANELCNAYSIDTITTGNVVAFFMELFEKKKIPKEYLDGEDYSFGNAVAMLRLIEMIVNQKGVGRELSKGIDSFARLIGLADDDAVLTIKGQPPAFHDPRIKKGLGIGYVMSPTGADHNHNIFDEQYEEGSWGMALMDSFGIHKGIPKEVLNKDKVRMLVFGHYHFSLFNSLVMCYFMPYSNETIKEIVNAATGWNTTIFELMQVGERSINYARLFNLREGLSVLDDEMPKRFKKVAVGPEGKDLVEEQDYLQAKKDYYAMMGWDEMGVPTHGKLLELQLEDFAW
ncbi:aldehyde ferredoxin oxidoreductase family protein [Clostridia bacterium]|nr:aldehyde ferredoxin oxidoreductase family protein [Clostridia bacterium]